MLPINMMNLNVQGIVNIIVTLVAIGFSFWAIQAIRWELFVARPKGPQAKLLYVFLSILLGSAIARFFVDYLTWSLMIR